MSSFRVSEDRIRLWLAGFESRIVVIETAAPDLRDEVDRLVLPALKRKMEQVRRCRIGVNENRRGYGVTQLWQVCENLNYMLVNAENLLLERKHREETIR